jgi:uncharacterized protein YndB with AHSA1/START domain
VAERRSDLATFDDRTTMRYVRVFRAPIERVWRAVTTSEQLDVWLLPISRVEPRLGGRATFTWGAPDHSPQVGEITVFEPPRRVRYQWREQPGAKGVQDLGYLEFELEPVSEGTRFTFIHHLERDFRQDQSGVSPVAKDASLPAGPDTPWRPGFVAGFHLGLDELGQFLSENWSEARIQAASARNVDIANGKIPGTFESGPQSPWSDLVEIYYDHIQKTCPPAIE